MRRLVLLLTLILLSSGCSWINAYLAGSDNTLPPAELAPIEQPITIQRLWEAEVGSGTGKTFIKLLPVVDQGRVYAAGHKGDVIALDADSGKSIWKVDTKLSISSGVGVGDGLVLVGTEKGLVLALHQEDGEEAWRSQVSSEILAAPRAEEGVVVVRSVDGKFTGLDSRSGERLWVYSYTEPVLTLRGASSPLLVAGLAIAGLENGKLLALSLRDGTPKLERTIAQPRGRTELERLVDIDSEPHIAENVLYVTAYQGNITAIDLRNGNTLWSRDFSSYAGLNVDALRVYVADNEDAVWALDRRNGGALWKQSGMMGRKLSAPVTSEDYVVVGDFEGYLHWLTKEDGKVVGRVQVDSKGIAAAPIVQGDTLYVLGKSGVLSAFRVGTS
jgi:outer membrane protein assembly factor BamB